MNEMNKRTHRYHSSGSTGFTLVELLMATTLMSIVMVSVYTTFASGIRVWRDGETGADALHEARLAMQVLRDDLQSIPPGTFHLFKGTEDTLEFYTLAHPMNVESDTGLGMMRVTYRVGARGGRTENTLLRTEARVEGPLPSSAGRGERTDTTRVELAREHTFALAGDLESFALRYLWTPIDDRSPTEPPSHRDAIEEREAKGALPHGISVSLTLQPADGSFGATSRTLTDVIVYRGPKSAVPREVLEREREGLQ